MPFTLLALEIFEAVFGLRECLNTLLLQFSSHLLHGVLAKIVHLGVNSQLFSVLSLLDLDQLVLVALVLADFLFTKVINDFL